MEGRLRVGEGRVEMQRLGIHGHRREQHVVGLGDGAAGPVFVQHVGVEFLEPQPALYHPAQLLAHNPSSRPISMSCTSVVPSPISRILLSR